MKLTSTAKDVEVGKIIVGGKRLRPVDADEVKALATSIAQVGLIQPIVVAKSADDDEYTLIAGRHRLAALKKLGHETVKAMVRTVASRDEALLLEIDENLTRKELTAAEEASQLKLRKELWEKLAAASGENLKGKGKTKPEMSAREMAKKTGKSKDTMARGIKRAKTLGDDLETVTKTSLDKGQELDALAKLKKLDKAKAAELVADAKAGKKVSAKKALKEAEQAKTKAAGAKAEKAAADKLLAGAVKVIGGVMTKYRDDLGGDERWNSLCDLFVEWCDEYGLYGL